MKKYSLKRFYKNIIHLFRYSIKEMYHNQLESRAALPGLVEKIKRETKNDWEMIRTFHIKDGFETIQELIDTQKSLIRFGDGEIMLMRTTGGGGIAFQKYDSRLAQGLREIIFSNDERLLIGIWREYYYSSIGLREPVREWMYEFVPQYYFIMEEFLRDSKVYGSTCISQVYANYEYYDFETHYSLMRKIWDNKDIVLICGDKIFPHIQYNILDNAKSVAYIYGPILHAYTEFDTLKATIEQISKDKLLLFALGPCGKVLAYTMLQQGYRVIDIGHAIQDYNAYKNRVVMDSAGIAQFFAPDL